MNFKLTLIMYFLHYFSLLEFYPLNFGWF